jgi:sigma-B regulation protein RsbU (phosphoserine phosphatase)
VEREKIEEQANVLANTVAELNEAKRVVEEQHRMITVELDMAAKLQRSLLPRRFPEVKGLSFASKYLPSNRIGGDFFDIIELGDGNIGVVIADVSGHGPAAALLTTMFKISFQMYALEVRSPSGVLARLNREFCRLITTGEYITAFYGVLNPRERRMTYAKAGHPYPILFRNNTGKHELLDAEGFFIGMFEEALFEDVGTSLEPGDRLFLYTDGVIEARNGTGVCFEIGHLVSILAHQQGAPCDAVVEEILKQLSEFTRKERFDDDLCMVLLSVDA